MERLNEILGRTAQRRQSPSEQRTQPEYPAQGARTSQTQPGSIQRPQTEQMTRLSQKYVPQPQNVQGQQGSMPPRQPQPYTRTRPRNHNSQSGQSETNTYENSSYPGPTSGTGYSDPIARADYGRYEQPDPRNTVMDSMAAYRQVRSQPHHEQARIQPLQPNSNNEYYPDDYASQLNADVLEDDYRMMDGDWEKGHGINVYNDEDIEIFEEPLPPRNYPASLYHRPTSETDPGTHSIYGSNVTPNTRDMRQPSAYKQKIQAPQIQQVPQARTQEVPRHQRITQPLNPQAVSGIAREREALRTSDPRLLRAARQAGFHEATPPALPPAPPATPVPASYTSVANTRAVCPKCRGAGYLRSNVPFGHPNFGKPIACDCKEAERKEKRRQQLRDMSNMDAFRSHNFRTFNARIPGIQEAFEGAVDFAENPEGWLILLGPNGCGKTHLAAAIANQSLDEGAVVLFEAVPDLLDHLRAAFAPTANEVYDQLFSKMREAELLVLDDLGAQQSSPWANEKLFQLLNYRYNMSMPTVITANNRAMQGIDERIRSRIGDASLVKTINMERARDYRPTNPKRR